MKLRPNKTDPKYASRKKTFNFKYIGNKINKSRLLP